MFPSLAPIGCAKDCALRAAGPRNSATDGVDPAKVGSSVGNLSLPLSKGRIAQNNEKYEEAKQAHNK